MFVWVSKKDAKFLEFIRFLPAKWDLNEQRFMKIAQDLKKLQDFMDETREELIEIKRKP